MLGAACAQTPSTQNYQELEGIKAMMSIPDILAITVSENGLYAAIVLETADWQQNWYDNEIHIWDGQKLSQLTDSSTGAAWAPRWRPAHSGLAYLQYNEGAGVQLYYRPSLKAAPIQLTEIDSGIIDFRWSPDGQSIALILIDPVTNEDQAYENTLGYFEVLGKNQRYRHLWILETEDLLKSPETHSKPPVNRDHPTLRRITGGTEFTVGSFFNNGGFEFTQDGSALLFDHSRNNSPAYVDTQDISSVHLNTLNIRPIVQRPGRDFGPRVSHDGNLIAFETSNGPYVYYQRDHIGVVSVDGGDVTLLTSSFPESAELVGWHNGEVAFVASDKMLRSHYRIHPDTLRYNRITPSEIYVSTGATSYSNRTLIFAGENLETGRGLFHADEAGVTQLTNDTHTIFEDVLQPSVQIIRSKAIDELESEGVLYLPDRDNDDPIPLMTIIHGGPKQTSRPTRIHDYIYPVTYWLSKGYAVFYPNYRGSAGFGDKYRSLNVRDLARGPAQDILSSVNLLVARGIADEKNLFVMGWSQGGYLAAFLATHTDRFKAASVGAGISDWQTYYIESDNPQFTIQYLEATPWADTEIYRQTSPLTAILCSTTPLLIQHGENDRRVPVANGLELHRAARDQGIEARMIIYKNIGHWISNPKERLVAAIHNINWFDQFIGPELSADTTSSSPHRLKRVEPCSEQPTD